MSLEIATSIDLGSPLMKSSSFVRTRKKKVLPRPRREKFAESNECFVLSTKRFVGEIKNAIDLAQFFLAGRVVIDLPL